MVPIRVRESSPQQGSRSSASLPRITLLESSMETKLLALSVAGITAQHTAARPLTAGLDSVRQVQSAVVGYNVRAISALVPAAIIAIVLALVPAFAALSGFSWFIGAGLALVFYLIVADRHRTFVDVDGEPIAVPSE